MTDTRLPSRIRLAAPAILTSFALACATTGGSGGGGPGFLAVNPAALPPAGHEPARVLVDVDRIRFQMGPDGPVAVETEQTQVQILTQAGEEYTQVHASYGSFFDVTNFDARVIDEQGRTVKAFTRKDAAEGPAFEEFMLYADSRVISLKVPDQAPGRIVEHAVVTRITSPQLFAFEHSFADAIPVLSSRFIVEVPDGFEIEHIGSRDGVVGPTTPRIEKEPGLTRYIWERNGIPALHEEKYAPPPGALAEHVAIRLAAWTSGDGAVVRAPADPPALSRFSYSIMKDRVQLTPELQAKVAEILQGVPDEPRAKARRLYAWTRDNIRYCAIAVGMGGWVPHSSVEVETKRYGDCKDKANLLKTLLKGAGIESRLVTIWSGLWPEPFMLPVLGANFNHAILLVDLPSGPVWVDPTTRSTAFDALPPNDTDRFALPISEKGDALTPTLASKPENDSMSTSAAMALDASGVARGTFTLETRGLYADALRDMLLETPEARQSEAVRELVSLDNAKLAQIKIEGGVPPEEVTPATVQGAVETRVSGALTKGKEVLFSARSLWAPEMPVIEKDRTVPVMMRFRQTLTSRVKLSLPAGASVARVPDPVVIDTPQFHYALTWAAVDGGLTGERQVVYKVRVVSVADLAAFGAAAAKVASAEEQKVVIRVAD